MKELRKYLYTKTTTNGQGSLWFSYGELKLNINKMFVTEARFPNVYSTTGFINLGNERHYHENALLLAKRLLKEANGSACIYFVPMYEKPFICYKSSGEDAVKLEVVGYFDYAGTVFERIGYDEKFAMIGLIEEVNREQFDIIEE